MVLWVSGDNEQRKDSSFGSRGRGNCAGHKVTHNLNLFRVGQRMWRPRGQDGHMLTWHVSKGVWHKRYLRETEIKVRKKSPCGWVLYHILRVKYSNRHSEGDGWVDTELALPTWRAQLCAGATWKWSAGLASLPGRRGQLWVSTCPAWCLSHSGCPSVSTPPVPYSCPWSPSNFLLFIFVREILH